LISITIPAKQYMQARLEKSGMKYARLALDGGGCAGFTYKWEETNTVEDGTLIEDIIIVDKTAELYVLGSEIDYNLDMRSCEIFLIINLRS
jgi:Fe-S cluster assembly iron-binding protein IscA